MWQKRSFNEKQGDFLVPAGEGLDRNLVSQQIVKEKRSDEECHET